MADFTPAQIQGLLVPESRFQALSLADCAYTEAGPRPGVPAAQQTGSAVLHTVGTQLSNGIIRLRTQSPGHPADFGASFLWRVTGSDDFRAWDPAWVLSGFAWLERSTTANAWLHPHMVTLSDETVLLVVVDGLRRVKTYRREAASTVWSSAVTVYDHGSAMSASPNPALCVLPSGRVLLYHWVDYTDFYGLRMWYSDDGGESWTLGSKQAITSAHYVLSSYSPKRIRAAYYDGTVCLVAWITIGTSDQLWQMSSTDSGVTFAVVDTYTDSDAAYPDVMSDASGFLVGWIQSSGGAVSATYVPHIARLGSSSQALTGSAIVYGQGASQSEEWASTSGGLLDDGDLSMMQDDDGAILLFGRRVSGTGRNTGIVSRSTDAGASFYGHTGPVALDASADTIKGFAATPQAGRVVLACTNSCATTTADDSIAIVECGGYTTQPMALGDGSPHLPDYVSAYEVAYLPIGLPQDLGTTWTATGAGADALSSTGLDITTTANERWYEDARTIGPTAGLVFAGQCTVTSGTAAVDSRCSDSTPVMYSVRALVSTTQVTLYDVNAGANVGSPLSIATSTAVQVRLVHTGASATLWYRLAGQQVWTQVATSSTLTSAASDPGGRIRFGSPTGTAAVSWAWCALSDAGKVPTLLTRTSGDMLGRSYTSGARGCYITDGVRLVADRGPTVTGDAWIVQAEADYGIDRLIPTATDNSPRRPWRSLTDGIDVDFVWSPDDGVATWPMTPMLAIYVMGANVPTMTLQGAQSGVYGTIGTLDFRLQSSLKFTRSGSTVISDVSGGSSVPIYLRRNALAGAHFRSDASTIRRIASNSDGVWRASSSYTQSRIVLDGVQGGDPASGTGGAIWMPNGLFLVPITQAYEKFRIRIGAQTTAEGYFSGRILLGSAYVWGMQPAWSHAIEHTWITEVAEQANGIRSMRSRAPKRPALEVGWPDGVNVEAIQKSSPPAPDRILAWTSGSGIGSRMDVPYSVPGLIDELQGATLPVVVIRGATMPANSSTITAVLDPDAMLYGHVITDTLRVDNVLGNPLTGELMRVGTVRVEGLT